MKFTLRIFGLIGSLFFIYAFSLTYYSPCFVEDIGKNFIQSKIQEKTDQKIDSIKPAIKNSALGMLAKKLYQQNEEKINQYREKLKNNTHRKIATVIAEMRNLDCECRKKHEERIKSGYESNIIFLENANQKLVEFMKVKYMEVSNKLKTDFRIFTGVNGSIFLLLLLISFIKPAGIKHLFLPGTLLFLSTSICSYFYLLEQNWFFTIIYNDYLGWGYLGWLSIAFAFLSDIVINSGRVTTAIINTLGEIFSFVGSVSPC